jgi:hypothetical protein
MAEVGGGHITAEVGADLTTRHFIGNLGGIIPLNFLNYLSKKFKNS